MNTLSHEQTKEFMREVINSGCSLSQFEADFIKSIVRISKKPKFIELTKGQNDVFEEIQEKVEMHKIDSLVDKEEADMKKLDEQIK